MKKRLRDYTLSRLEINILKEIIKGNHSLTKIRNSLLISPSLLSYNIRKLDNTGLIRTIKNGRKKNVYFANSKHASLLRELLLVYDHVKWENILSGLNIEVLFEVLNDSEIGFKNFSRVTFWRKARTLKSHGIIKLDNNGYSINPRFLILENFLIEYQRYIIDSFIRSVSEKAVILWQKDFECLFRAPKNLDLPQKNLSKTATSRFGDFGIPIFSNFDIYFYSRTKKTIRMEDLVLHTLLIDRDSVRYTLYSLLLLKKKWKTINEEYLLREAQRLDLNLLINAMLQFLRTRGMRKGKTLPTWEEFMAKARDYGIVN